MAYADAFIRVADGAGGTDPAQVLVWDGSAGVPVGRTLVLGGAPPPGGSYDELDAGAVLPITDPLPTGTLRFVAPAPIGSDSNTGTQSSPYATVSKALSTLSGGAGQYIIMRGGTYSLPAQRASIGKQVHIRAYPGETPVLDGSVAVGAMTAEGDLRRFAYRSLPVKFNAEGVHLTVENFYPPATFDGSGNPTGLAALRGFANVTASNRYSIPSSQTFAGSNGLAASNGTGARVITGALPDQCWAGGQLLTRVFAKSLVRPGHFWVDRPAGTADPMPAADTTMYVHADDAAKGIRVSVSPDEAQPFLFLVTADNVALRGLRIEGHSSHKGFFAVQTGTGVSGLTLEDVEIIDTANIAIKLYGDQNNAIGDESKLVKGATLRRVTVSGSGWMGMSAQYTDDTLMTACRFELFNRHGETQQSPKNGAMKGSKNHRFVIEHCLIKDCISGHGIWFDQSNYDCTFASNQVKNVDGSPLFWEISHKVLIINNLFVKGNNSGINVRVSGGSGVRFINNTVVGGAYPLYVIAELRGQLMGDGQWFAEQDYRYTGAGFQTTPLGSAGLSSDIDRARPGARHAAFGRPANLTPGMEFKGGAIEVVNNVIVHTGSSNPAVYYRGRTANGGVNVPSNEVVPGWMDGNVYQSANGQIAWVDSPDAGAVAVQTTLAGWRAALGDPYYSYVAGAEAASFAGSGYADPATGAPLAPLLALEGQVATGPTDAAAVVYVPSANTHPGTYLTSS